MPLVCDVTIHQKPTNFPEHGVTPKRNNDLVHQNFCTLWENIKIIFGSLDGQSHYYELHSLPHTGGNSMKGQRSALSPTVYVCAVMLYQTTYL